MYGMHTRLILALLLPSAVVLAGGSRPYLSNLSASANSPLFTTYAAPLQRSEFVVDEGYQFLWYDPARGAEFITDTGGKLCLAFKLNGQVRHTVSQFSTAPIVTTSYSDIVRYYYYPFKGIRVDAVFLVYSSRIALQDLTVTNEGSEAARLSVYPYIEGPNGGVHSASFLPAHDGLTFSHREPPDGWTTGHSVPFQENLVDVFLLDTVADGFGGYAETGVSPSASHPGAVKAAANYCVEWGRVYHADGSACLHAPPVARQVIRRSASMAEILTELAPKWGDVDPNIPGNGYQGCELGNFSNPPVAAGDTIVVTFTCSATGEAGSARTVVPPLPAQGGVYLDVQCLPAGSLAVPGDVASSISPDSLSAAVSWTPSAGCMYSVFRRSGANTGTYRQVAGNLAAGGYTDTGYRADSAFAYVVVPVDSAGNVGGHSNEVGGAVATQFFVDLQNPFLDGRIPSGNFALLALQKDLTLGPGAGGRLRFIRGVAPSGDDPEALASACRSLRATNLLPFIANDERVCSSIPQIPFRSSDEEMMYWSAFNMMRQCMLPPEGECSYNYNVYSREPTWGWGHAGEVFHENLSMLAYVFMDPQSAQSSQLVFAERMSAQAAWPAGFVPYRSGPYLDEVNYLAGEYSSSAPWFNYENWELFRVSGDTAFLRSVYPKGVAFYNFWETQRDDDKDGLSEWGGHAFWESVRDYNVIWDLLGGWADPHSANRVEALDLNCELVMEAKSLARIAAVLGKQSESQEWSLRAGERAARIDSLMWDPSTRFYYHVIKNTHTFTYLNSCDLKRKEHIGFLPLWAGIADADQAGALVREIFDSTTFGRPYGIPLQAHNETFDLFYTRSVFPEWDFLVFRGLEDYGYLAEARTLADRLFADVIQVLKDRHDFYESYNCDEKRPSDSWLHSYIWTGVVARMLIDLANPPLAVREAPSPAPERYALLQNYPNPFNPSTTVTYQIPATGHVSLALFDILGRSVVSLVEGIVPAGVHRVTLDAAGLASGVYILRFAAGGFTDAKKIMVLR
jgi:hypothetical protein